MRVINGRHCIERASYLVSNNFVPQTLTISNIAISDTFLHRAAMHAFAYEVGLRDVFEEDEACRTPIFTLSSPRGKGGGKHSPLLLTLILLCNKNLDYKLGLDMRK